MERGGLSRYFEGVMRKRLTAVETNPKKSNQHEVGTARELRELLGHDKRNFTTRFFYFEGEQSVITDDGTMTYYDTRKNDPKRSPEFRMYYSTNDVTHLMEEGDTLFFAVQPGNESLFIVASEASLMGHRLSWLFGLTEQAEFRFDSVEYEGHTDGEIDFLARQILDQLGIEYEDPNANSLDTIIERFGLSFPKTKVFSALARQTLPAIDAADDPDFALMAWLDHEEAMFRRLEKRIVSQRLLQGFKDGEEADVDAFVNYSLSVQNRRKSRMGHSLENHISAVFDAQGVLYAAQFKTFKGKKPDYIFPSADAYLDTKHPVENLTMLAAKSSCKDRWSQVLSEADRIPVKHLLTLDPGIPQTTTDTMQADALQLVVPKDRHETYTASQRSWLFSFADFIALVKTRQAVSGH